MELVASGVESFDMLRVVADAGVAAVQGTITGGPMSLGELEDCVTTRNLSTIVDLQASITAMQLSG